MMRRVRWCPGPASGPPPQRRWCPTAVLSWNREPPRWVTRGLQPAILGRAGAECEPPLIRARASLAWLQRGRSHGGELCGGPSRSASPSWRPGAPFSTRPYGRSGWSLGRRRPRRRRWRCERSKRSPRRRSPRPSRRPTSTARASRPNYAGGPARLGLALLLALAPLLLRPLDFLDGRVL